MRFCRELFYFVLHVHEHIDTVTVKHAGVTVKTLLYVVILCLSLRRKQREDRLKKHIPVIFSTACLIAVITSQNHNTELAKSEL